MYLSLTENESTKPLGSLDYPKWFLWFKYLKYFWLNLTFRIIDVLGEEESVTREHLSKLIYLEAAIKEAVRLYPIGPIVAREATTDIQLGRLAIAYEQTEFKYNHNSRRPRDNRKYSNLSH